MAQKFLTGVQLTDGSAGSPALSFSSDTNTGIYWNTYSGDAKQLNIATDGTVRASFNSAGITSYANIYSGPSGQFRNYAGVWKATTGTTGNGFEFSSADQTGAMTLTSNGNLKVHNNIRSQGHSTTGLSGKGMELRFFTDTDIGSILSYDRTNNTYLPVGVFGSTVSLQTNGAERLHITNAGNVGIGVTPASIDQKLRVNGNIKVGDSQKFVAGVGDDLQIQHTGTHSFITNATGDLIIANYADDRSIYLQSDDGSGGSINYIQIEGSTNQTKFQKNTKHLDDVRAIFGASNDLQIYHNSTSSNGIIENSTNDLVIQNNADNKDIIFRSDNGSGGVIEYLRLDGSDERLTVNAPNGMLFFDNIKAKFGTGGDLQILHDGSNSYVRAEGTGDLVIEQKTDDKDILFKSDDGSGGVTTYILLDGSLKKTQFWQSTRHIDNVYATFGISDDLQIYHNGTDSVIDNTTGDLYITNKADDKDIIFRSDDGSGGFTTYFFLDGSSVTTQFYKTIKLYDAAFLYIGDGNDLQFYHNGTNSTIANYTGTLYIANNQNDGDIAFQCDDGSGGITEYILIDGSAEQTKFSKDTKHIDNARGKFGDSNDLSIFHNGSNSYIENTTGDLFLVNYANDKDIRFYSDNGSGGAVEYFRVDGNITKTVFIRDTKHEDSVKGLFGTNDDLQIYHDGSNSYIKQQGAATGDLIIEQNVDDGDIIFRSDNGGGGVTTYFKLDGTNKRTRFEEDILIADTKRLRIGSGADLQIYHDGSNSFVSDLGTGNLNLQGSIVAIESPSGENYFVGVENSYSAMYYDNSIKLQTTSTGISITGDLTVSGTTTTVNQTNLDVSDNIIGLNRGASTNTNDSGLIIERGSTGDNAAFLWDESEDKFVFGLTTATPSATGNVSLSDFRGIKTGPITASGSITASSDVTTSGSYFADTHFRSTDGNATLSATGGGGVYLRPNGFSSTTGQAVIDAANGDATFSGGIQAGLSGSIHGTDNQTASIYMNTSGVGLSGKFGSYARNIIRSNGTNTIQIGDNTSLISLIQLKAGSSSVDGVIQLMTHNTERMRVTHDGRVGVNTSSPGAKLHVVESTTNTQALRVDDGTSFVSVVPSLGSGGYTGVSSAGDIGLIFSIDGDNTTDTTNGLLIAPHTQTSGGLKILENGNVGIGVATPNTKLQVAGIIQSTESGNSAFYGGDYVRVFNNQNFRFRNSGGTVIANIGMSGDSYFNGGNVGIGTTSPAAKFNVQGSGTIGWGNLGNALVLAGTTSYGIGIDANEIAGKGDNLYFGTIQNHSIIIRTNGANERMRITNTGNVGIANTSPAYKLDVGGTSRIGGTIHMYGAVRNYSGNFSLQQGVQDSDIFFKVNDGGTTTTVMTIDGSESTVGIGTTAPQTNTKLEVSGALKAGNKTSWSDRDGAALTTTGRVVAGLTGNANGNGASALYIFTCYGGGGYQRIAYSCRNQSGTWVVNKDIDEGVDAFDVVASTPSSGSAVTFTFKGRTSSQGYTASVFIEHMGHNLDTQYVG